MVVMAVVIMFATALDGRGFLERAGPLFPQVGIMRHTFHLPLVLHSRHSAGMRAAAGESVLILRSLKGCAFRLDAGSCMEGQRGY